MTLEELTKEELIKLIRKSMYSLPTQRDMLGARWERLTGEAQRIMAQACEESEKWTGVRTMEGFQKWRDAQELFNKGMRISEHADKVYKEMMESER